jgi:hypothetical protein
LKADSESGRFVSTAMTDKTEGPGGVPPETRGMNG